MTTMTARSQGKRNATQDTLPKVSHIQSDEMKLGDKLKNDNIRCDGWKKSELSVLKIQNSRLKKLLLEALLENASLREVLRNLSDS